jgi:hypothetical protein
MDRWKVADLTVFLMELVALAVLTISYRLRNNRRASIYIYVLFGIRLGFNVVLLVLLATFKSK